MRGSFAKAKAGLGPLIGRFRRDQKGQIAIIFGFSVIAITIGVGASIDLARAYVARQKLSEVAELTCQYSNRPSVVDIANPTYSGTGGGLQLYQTVVNTFALNALSSQNLGALNVTDSTPAKGTNYFSATAATGVVTSTTGTAPTNPVVELSANVPAMFMQMIQVPQIAVHAKINCLAQSTMQSNGTVTHAPQIDVSNAPNHGTNFVLQESFETSCGGYCFTTPTGTPGTLSSPTSTTPASPSYIGSSGQPWYVIGYCLEVDHTGQINATTPDGSHSVELDCDNGASVAANDHGNSSLTTKVYLAPGSYELRYNYRSRVDYPSYDPAYICGSTAADVAWANDTAFSGAVRTNQVNVYLDLAATSTIPLHTTIDGTQQLGGSNLVDVCVYSNSWIERSVKIDVATPAYYWVSFAADGTSDAQGAQIDNIRICQNTCTAPLQDNFPASWLAANNGGVNKLLFEDTFETPTYTQDAYTSSAHSKGGNLAKSLGVTVSSTCSYAGVSPPGYPCQSPTGWAVAPYNEVVFWEQGATQGSQYVSLQGWNGFSNASDPINRSISKSFLLDPGYYNISYGYTSLIDFSYDFQYGVSCIAVPTSFFAYTGYGTKHGHDIGDTTTLYSQYQSTNVMNVTMANGQLISTPSVNATLGAAPTYTNPDGTLTATPAVAPDNGSNFAAYNAAAVNPVIDTCIYSSGFGWTTRSVNVQIAKPGLYWLTFSAQGDPLTGLGAGPGLDDVKLTALGSYTMTPAPTAAVPVAAANATPVALPVPDPQPDTVYYGLGSTYNGFTIIADPFLPPSAN